MGNFRWIIHIFYEMVGNVFATLELTWYYVCPTRASWRACARQNMLFTKDLSRLGLMASLAAITASCNCCSVVRGLSILRICIAIWSQICSIWFLSGLLVGQSMTSTSWFSKKKKSHGGPSLVRSINFNQHKFIAKGAPCPRQDILPEHPSVNLLVYGTLNND